MHRHGVLLGAKLLSSPEITISPDGWTTSETWMRFGLQSDKMCKKSRLTMAEANVVLERPVEVHTGKLKVSSSWAMRSSAVRVRYLDEELMIVRDADGFADVLFRIGTPDGDVGAAEPAADRAPRSQERIAALDAADLGGDEGNPQVTHDHVQRLSGQLEALTGSLEAQRARATGDLQEHRELTRKAADLEKALKAASVDARARAAQLGALEVLRGRLLEEESRRTPVFAARADDLAAMEVKAAGLVQEMEERRSSIAHAKAHVVSLQAQAKQLAREAWHASRGGRPAYRAAVAEVKAELRDARQKAREVQRAEVALTRELRRKDVELGRQELAVQADAKKEAILKEMLEEQLSELAQRRLDASEASAKEEALSKELGDLRSRLQELERRGTDSRGVAAQVERALYDVARRVREARKAARHIQGGARRVWPWR